MQQDSSAGDAMSTGPTCSIPEVARWFTAGVHLQEQDVLDRRATFTLVAGRWRAEAVAVKVAAENADLSSGRLDDAATRTRVVKAVASEAAFLSSLRHDNIVHLYGVTQHPGSGLPCLVLERLQESVEQRRRRGAAAMTLRDVVDVSWDICRALHYLHHEFKPAVAHRDISSRNILLAAATGRAKLSGLSSARALAGKQPATKLPGSDEYMPPETALGDMPQYSTKIDIFSLGVVVIEMAANRAPSPKGRFVSRARGVAIVPETKRRADELAVVKDTQPRLLAVVQLCLQDEKRRPTSGELDAALRNVQSTIDYLESPFTLGSGDGEHTAAGGQTGMPSSAAAGRADGPKSPPKPKRNFPVGIKPRPLLHPSPTLSPAGEHHGPPASSSRSTSSSSVTSGGGGGGVGGGNVMYESAAEVKGYTRIEGLALGADGTVQAVLSPNDSDSDSEWDSEPESPAYDSIDESDLDAGRKGDRQKRSNKCAVVIPAPEEQPYDDVELLTEDGYQLPADFKKNGYVPKKADDDDHVYQDVASVQLDQASKPPRKKRLSCKRPAKNATKPASRGAPSHSNPCYTNASVVAAHASTEQKRRGYEEITDVLSLQPAGRGDGVMSAQLPPLAKKFHGQVAAAAADDSSSNGGGQERREAKLGRAAKDALGGKSPTANQYVTTPRKQPLGARLSSPDPRQLAVAAAATYCHHTVDRRVSEGDTTYALAGLQANPPPLPGEELGNAAASKHVSFGTAETTMQRFQVSESMYETPEVDLRRPQHELPQAPTKSLSSPDLMAAKPAIAGRPIPPQKPLPIPPGRGRGTKPSPASQQPSPRGQQQQHGDAGSRASSSSDVEHVDHGLTLVSLDGSTVLPNDGHFSPPGNSKMPNSPTSPPAQQQQQQQQQHQQHGPPKSPPSRTPSGRTLVTLPPVSEYSMAATHGCSKPMVRSPRVSSDDLAAVARREHADDSSNWFHGPIPREEAEERLKHSAVGSFLVRSGRTHSGFTISWRAHATASRPVKHVIVDQPRPGAFQLRHSPVVHTSMEDLIRNHHKEPLTTSATDLLGNGISA